MTRPEQLRNVERGGKAAVVERTAREMGRESTGMMGQDSAHDGAFVQPAVHDRNGDGSDRTAVEAKDELRVAKPVKVR